MTTRCVAWNHHRWSGLRESVRSDVVRYLYRSPESISGGDDFKHRLSAFCTPQLFALTAYRLAHFLTVRGWRRAAALVTWLNQILHRVSIHPASCIGPACLLPHPAGVTFCGSAGSELTLYSLAICCPTDVRFTPDRGPKIGDRVTLGGHAVVMGDVTVGSDTKVSFIVNLTADAPPGVIVVSKAMRVAVHPAAREIASVAAEL